MLFAGKFGHSLKYSSDHKGIMCLEYLDQLCTQNGLPKPGLVISFLKFLALAISFLSLLWAPGRVK